MGGGGGVCVIGAPVLHLRASIAGKGLGHNNPDSTKTSDRPRIRASRATAISSG